MNKQDSITFHNKLQNEKHYQSDRNRSNVPWKITPHTPFTPKSAAEISNLTKNRVYIFAKEHPLVVLNLEQMDKIVILLWEIIQSRHQAEESNLHELDLLEFRSTKEFMIVNCGNQKMVTWLIATISHGELSHTFKDIHLKAVKATLVPMEFFHKSPPSSLDTKSVQTDEKSLWQQYCEALQDLRVDVKIRGTNQDDAYKEFSSILTDLRGLIASTITSDFTPRFTETKITDNTLEITCHDNQTHKWLLYHLQSILAPSHKHGVKFERNPVAFLQETKVTLMIPGHIDDRNTVLARISAQNPELRTINWTLYRSDYLNTGHKVYLRIDSDSAFTISKQDGWIFYELGKLKMELGSKIPKGCKMPNTSIVINKFN